MEIVPLAYDSFGVRSMCTLVSFKNLKIIIDPGVALAPSRYGLNPTKEEFETLKISREKIMEVSKLADVTIVTHYHYDHHPYPQDDEMYEKCFGNKMILAKDTKKNINFSGRKRGKIFEERVKRLAKSLEYADRKDFEFGDICISFSPAVWHGDVGSKVGTVIMVFINRKKESFLFGSDAQSLADPKALDWVKEKNPDFLILDGYPTIFLGWKMSEKAFLAAKDNLKEAMNTGVKEIILDHHIVRDIGYREKVKDIFELAEKLGKKVCTAAEFFGMENFFLEAWRKEIYKGERKVDVKNHFKNLFEKIEARL